MGIEFKNKVDGEALGVAHAAKESRLESPLKGIPIRENNNRAIRGIRRYLEELLGLRSWIDNI